MSALATGGFFYSVSKEAKGSEEMWALKKCTQTTERHSGPGRSAQVVKVQPGGPVKV